MGRTWAVCRWAKWIPTTVTIINSCSQLFWFVPFVAQLQSVTLELGSIEEITLICCAPYARPSFPCPFQCWPRTWTRHRKNHYKITLEERKTGIRAVWPNLNVLDCACYSEKQPYQGKFNLSEIMKVWMGEPLSEALTNFFPQETEFYQVESTSSKDGQSFWIANEQETFTVLSCGSGIRKEEIRNRKINYLLRGLNIHKVNMNKW